jgi:hypothetical protein
LVKYEVRKGFSLFSGVAMRMFGSSKQALFAALEGEEAVL